MNIYVGNLAADVSEDDLRKLFETFGAVLTINIIKDRYTGETRGFGFIEMPTELEAQAAIKGLDGTKLNNKVLAVSKARPRTEMGGRGQGYGGGKRQRY